MYDSIGEKVKFLRNQKNLSQKSLAKIVGVPQSSLSDFENGKNNFNIEKVGLIANVLNISLDDLLHDFLIKYTKTEKNETNFYDMKLDELLNNLNEHQLSLFDDFIDNYLECRLLNKDRP